MRSAHRNKAGRALNNGTVLFRGCGIRLVLCLRILGRDKKEANFALEPYNKLALSGSSPAAAPAQNPGPPKLGCVTNPTLLSATNQVRFAVLHSGRSIPIQILARTAMTSFLPRR